MFVCEYQFKQELMLLRLMPPVQGIADGNNQADEQKEFGVGDHCSSSGTSTSSPSIDAT
jgi:hypothetical protein